MTTNNHYCGIRIRHIQCVEETGADWTGSDEIAFGGVKIYGDFYSKTFYKEINSTTRFRLTTRHRFVLRDFKVYTHWRATEQRGDRHEFQEPTPKPPRRAQTTCQWA